jgi:hypothetical protein
MILPLRERHRRVFVVLGVLLPIAFVVGIAARNAVPRVATLPPELSSWSQTFTATDYDRDELFTTSPVRVQLWREQDTGRFAVGFVAAKDFLKPDLIVYWIAGHPNDTDELPAEATLLGAFSAGPLLLPVEATTADGSLILFSLADQEIVDVSKPTRFSESTK